MRQAKLLKQDVLYNKWGKQFCVDTLQMGDGVVGEWSYIKGRGGVMVVAITTDKKIVLVRQFRYTIQQFTYENCAGGVEKDETEADAVKRELLEESGYQVGEIVSLGKYYDLPSETNHWCHIYLATNCQFISTPVLDSDVEKYFEMSIESHDFLEVFKNIGTDKSLLKSAEHSYGVMLAHRYLTENNLL